MTSWVYPNHWAGPNQVFRFEKMEDLVSALSDKLSIHPDLRPRNRGPVRQNR